MTKIIRKCDLLTKEQKKHCQNELMCYFETERNEQIGIIGTAEIIELVVEHTAEAIYNQGITDAKKLLQGKHEDAMFELDALQYVQRKISLI
jgi:uncharacterized protein (DUF2164 family)